MGLRWCASLSIALFGVVAPACGPVVGADGGTGTTDADPDSGPSSAVTLDPPTTTGDPSNPTVATTLDPDPDTGIDPDPSDDTSDDCGPNCCAFLCVPDGGGDGGDCDVWAQDCPRGEKCTPWANDGGDRWNSARCSPVSAPARELGEACAVEGSGLSGIDECGLGLLCLYVDPTTLLGTCVANCEGDEANPSCADPSTSCVVDFDGVLHQCLPACDPIAQDCAEGNCYPFGRPEVEGFACGVPLVPGVASFGACTHDWECAQGSMCAREGRPPACALGDCCTPMCDLTAPDTCGPERVCTPILPEGQGPPELQEEGYCALP